MVLHLPLQVVTGPVTEAGIVSLIAALGITTNSCIKAHRHPVPCNPAQTADSLCAGIDGDETKGTYFSLPRDRQNDRSGGRF
jgi:hypothetical protein